MMRRWTMVIASGLLMGLFLTACPKKEAPAADDPAKAEKANEGEGEAAKPAEPEAPEVPLIPEGVEHLKNAKWVDGPAPTDIPEVNLAPGKEAYGKIAGAREGALGQACAADAAKVYQLDPAVSRVGFVSYKNESLPVPGKIGDIHGYAVLGEKPALSLWANLLTVNTGSKGRDARLATLFFEGEEDANAVLTFEAESLEGLPAKLPTEEGASVEVLVKGKLTLHGKTVPLSVPLVITRKGEFWQAEEKGVTLIQFGLFDLIKPLEALLTACNHKAMGTAVALDLDLKIIAGC